MNSSNLEAQKIELCRKDPSELLNREEIKWKQRAKDHYVREGDQSTRYFHMTTTRRRRNNFISGIKDEMGEWHQDPNKIEEVILRYFINIFTSSNTTDMEKVYEGIEQRLLDENRFQLDKEFSAAEIKQAITQMNPNKAPGPDGMTAWFYQKFWPVMGQDIIKVLMHFLNGNSTIPSINHTNIVLIPKIQSPCLPQQFRPISLCNVIYKITAKVLANRLKGVLHEIND